MRRLYLLAAVAMAGVSAVFALLAELEKQFDLSTTSLGWIAGSAFLAALVTQLWLARYADRGHATTLLRLGTLIAAAGLIWFGASTQTWQFVAARALLGAGVGMIIPPARRAIVLTSGDSTGERLGAFYAAYLAGFVFGPPVASALTVLTDDVRVPFLVFGIGTVAVFFSLIGLELPESQRGDAPTDAESRRVIRRLLRSRAFVASLLIIVSFRYSIGVFEPLWATHLDDLGASTLLIGVSLTFFALPMLIVARPAGRLSDRYNPRVVSLLAAAATVPMMAVYGYAGVVWIIFLVAVPHGLMEAILSPGSQAAIAEATADDDAASAQGLAEAGGSAASAIGAFTAPAIFEALGAGPAWLIAAGVMSLLLTCSYFVCRPGRLNDKAEKGERGQLDLRQLSAREGPAE
ncbi:MAG: MFS family permease [Candidatus Poriferisodalaceae bacterium]